MSDARRYFALPSPFPMKRGGVLHGARLAYETWGELNAARDNAIMILTGLSPSAHAASNVDDPTPGWWEEMIGAGKPIDTTRWFVICINTLGSCKGSTGPADVNPETGTPYRLDFPELTLEDAAHASHALVHSLGIGRLACLVGNSMGGMTALAYLVLHPGSARAHQHFDGAAGATFAIAIRSLQREAIRLDPNWHNGAYDDARYPEAGMSIARKLGVITYRSAMEWVGRFARIRLDSEQREDDPFAFEFQIESYLAGHARRFVRSFDPNAYLYLSRASDWFDIGEHAGGSVEQALARIDVERALVVGVETDILFPLPQQEQIAEGLRAAGADVDFVALDSPQGHDAFLVDIERFGAAIARFLAAR